MIAYLKGLIAAKDAYGIVMDVGGVGYSLLLSTNALAQLPMVGNPAQVFTYMQVKEDGIALFGFYDMAEKDMFTKLIGVSGIGPKMALSALSTFKPQELAAVIADGDIARVSTISGVGKKTAQRIVLELQGILKSEATLFNMPAEKSGAMADAAQALESMGFSADEISAALQGFTNTGQDVSAIVRYALKNMGGKA